MPYITHTLIWLIIFVALPNSKWFIGANCMPYIAHTLIWLHVSVVLPHRKQFERVNRVPYIAHATKIWTVFDASSIANVLYISDGFHTPPFAIMASYTVSRRVSDRSVALAASCSSESTVDRVGLYVIDRLSISSGNTTPCFPASSSFPIYISWLWCTPFM